MLQALIAWGSKNRNRLIELCDQGELKGAFLDRAFYTGSLPFAEPLEDRELEAGEREWIEGRQ